MSWQINKFWNKVSNEDVNLNDIEEYIYSSEYLNIQNPIEFNEIKNIYNTKLVRYFLIQKNIKSKKTIEKSSFRNILMAKLIKMNIIMRKIHSKNSLNTYLV